MVKEEILLVYDKECPVCDSYCQAVRIRANAGDLRIVNARENSEVMNEITSHGLDMDQGMVIKMDDRLYYGSDAIHALALNSDCSGVFNRVNYWAFHSRTVSGFLYPVLRFFRKLLLKILGKTRVNNLRQPDSEYF